MRLWDDLLAWRYDAPWRCARSPGRDRESTILAGPWFPGGPALRVLAWSIDGGAAMARNHPKKAPRSKPAPAAPSAKPRAGAHARLVHGFLVNRAPAFAVAAKAAAGGSTGLSAILAHAHALDSAASEAPADGATFH
jgi:hypothetical protein